MVALKGVIKDGQVVLPQRADLPDGTEVEVLPLGRSEPEEDTPPDPDEIARRLALMEQVQPFAMTDEERAAWQADRQTRKDSEKAKFGEHAEKLRRMWE
jgi:hypothetical protein